MTRKYFLMTFKYTLLLVFVLAGITTSAQEKVPAEMPDTNFHIYLLMGQSNMAGRGKVEGAFLERSHERVLVLNKRKEWVGARNPLHFDTPKVAGVGPGLTFGIKRSEEHTSELQLLMRISYAVFCLTKKNQQKTQDILVTSRQLDQM